MKKVLVSLLAVFVLTVAANAQEESKSIGLSFGIDYTSKYLWRGTEFYSGEGAFFPSVSYNVLGSGLTLGVSMELSDAYLFESEGDKAAGYDFHSIDAGLDYEYDLNGVATLGLGVWYWGYFNSEDATGADASFITTTLSAAFSVPLAPFVSFTWDYYLDDDYAEETTQDFYVQFGIGHEVKLVEGANLNLGIAAGYYNAKTSASEFSGISDITTTVGLSVEAGSVTYTSSFNYAILPSEDDLFGNEDDKHKFYANFGVSYSL